MRAPIGIHIRRKRLELGLSQVSVARHVGISASYLNLIESNKRDVGGTLLLRIAEHLGLDIHKLTGERELKSLQMIDEMLRDPLLQGLDFRQTDTRDLVARFPEVAQAMVRIYRAHSASGAEIEVYANRFNQDPVLAQMLHEVLNRIAGMRSGAEIISDVKDLAEADRRRFTQAINHEARAVTETMNSLVGYFDRGAVRRRAIAPLREVEDAFISANNHFPELEDIAEAQRAAIGEDFSEAALERHLEREHGITCRRWPEGAPWGDFPATEQGRLDRDTQTLWLRGSSRRATRQFRICRQIAELQAHAPLTRLCDGLDLTSEAARQIAMRALASYVAGAMVMPYEGFRKLAAQHHYDVDLLGHLHDASFEQVAHRLVSLRRPGAEGVPFGFLRIAPAGRLTKRFPLPGLAWPSGGHGCPLWPVYSAPGAPGVLRQIAEFPNGKRFLLIAKSVQKRVSNWQDQSLSYSIMLACDIHHADRTVYARGLDLSDLSSSVPVGPSCLLCARKSCSHRQEDTPLVDG
ncbi:helix-turn-helix domain-containing protein [Paracoccus sp. (in: a-proteobacteria)]|uniref:helix-turn-helix domain-containing protein n=1 Tax=Paracoccus sp. TaxID=267 RepID=UPI002AFE4649|nr:short-chain fatty acyl-CoA regulator family protein [Paracoccus sp. (in: a-proteobacteria)]